MFSAAEIERLASGQPVGEPLPFDPADDGSIRHFYEELVRRVECERSLRSRVEWNHYGSGYASFIDAWFYPANGSARLSTREEGHTGLVVLFSRLSNGFVLGEGKQTWSAKSSSGYLPCSEFVDDIQHPAIRAEVAPVAALLTDAGLRRLHRAELDAPLPETCQVPTILADGPFRQYDALFHWED